MKNKKFRKEEIIENSIDLMYLKGYNGTSVKDITDAAGIPKGSFYNYFKDKEHYAIDALVYYHSDMGNKRMQILKNKDMKPLDRINGFFMSGIETVVEKGLKYGCFIGNLTQEMGDVDELISKTAAKLTNEIVSLIHENLREAHENKELRKEVDLKVLANFILESWQGALIRMKMASNKTALDDFYTVLTEILLK